MADIKTDSGSSYFRLRQLGYSDEEARNKIYGTKKGRIKGWKKINSTLDSPTARYRYVRWINNNTMVTVEKVTDTYYQVYLSRWLNRTVGYWKTTSLTDKDGITNFKSKKEAMNVAKNYMRSHPNG